MDSEGTRGLRRLEEICDYPANLVAPEPHKTYNFTYRLQATWLVWQSSSNEGFRHQSQDPVPDLFHKRSTE
jgi:hypothetical protein